MSIKDVRDYHLRMTADYMELKETIKQLESEITNEMSSEALKNIEILKKRAESVQENYNRINYIIYLLDMPTKKKKQKRWTNQEKRRLESIPTSDRLEAVQEENKSNLDELKKYMKC